MMKIAIDLDNTINDSKESIQFFSILTNLLAPDPDHKIYIITNREPGTEQDIAEELDYLGIDYSEIVITDKKAEFILKHGITVFVEDTDEYMLCLPNSVFVLKARNDANYNFDTHKWVTSRKNSILIDD